VAADQHGTWYSESHDRGEVDLHQHEHDPRNDVLTSAKRAEEVKHRKYDATCAAIGSKFSPFALETTGGLGASTAAVYFLFAKQLRNSGLPADVLVGKLKRTSFALLRNKIAQVTTALDAAKCAVGIKIRVEEDVVGPEESACGGRHADGRARCCG
jgi:hypothetical protein